ncbi:MAG: hypothetical protein Q9191_005056 [Dirinaria sp. TL-2023a]
MKLRRRSFGHDALLWLAVQIFLLVCAAVSAASIALPQNVEQIGLRRPDNRSDRSFSLLAHRHHAFLPYRKNFASSSSYTLSKRTHNMRIHDVKVYAITMPVFRAAASLSSFYAAIVRECASNWIDIPPLWSLRISSGVFALAMQGVGQPIPWALVAEVAANMLMVTTTGFTGTYDLRYVNTAALNGEEVGQIVREGVSVQFRIGDFVGQMGSINIDMPLQRF